MRKTCVIVELPLPKNVSNNKCVNLIIYKKMRLFEILYFLSSLSTATGQL